MLASELGVEEAVTGCCQHCSRGFSALAATTVGERTEKSGAGMVTGSSRVGGKTEEGIRLRLEGMPHWNTRHIGQYLNDRLVISRLSDVKWA